MPSPTLGPRCDRLGERSAAGLAKRRRERDRSALTCAFQYTGTRTVVASLWSIVDTSTSELMDFYAGLARGLDKDEALRRGQRGLLSAAGRRPGLLER